MRVMTGSLTATSHNVHVFPPVTSRTRKRAVRTVPISCLLCLLPARLPVQLPTHWRANRTLESSFQIKCKQPIPDGTRVVLLAGIGAARDVRIKNNVASFHNNVATL